MSFGRGLHQKTPTRGYGIKVGVAVIGAEGPPLPVPTVKVRAPVLEVSEDLSWELDGQALGGLTWDGAKGGESWRRGRETVFPRALREHRAGDLSQGSKHSLSHHLVPVPLYKVVAKTPWCPQNTCTSVSLVANKQATSPNFLVLEDLVAIPHALLHLPPQPQRYGAHPHHAPCM